MKWKTFAAVIAMILAVRATLPAATLDPSVRQSKGAVSKEDVRKAIAIFRRNPSNAQGEMSQPLILSFGKDSPDVEIAVSEKRMPWNQTTNRPRPPSAPL